MSEEATKQLFSGIIEAAHKEAARILKDAANDVETIKSATAQKIKEFNLQEEAATKKRLVQIQRLEESSKRSLERKYRVSLSERLRQKVLAQTAQMMEGEIGKEHYRQVLIEWIGEAAIGLDRDEARVNCSFKEKIDETMLREAEELVKKAIGKKVKLHLGGAILTGQGIEVASLDGKVAYNNQVTTRLIRHDRDLKELMEGEPCHKE